MDSRRYLVVLNPAAGRGAAARANRAIRGALDAAGVRHRVVETQARGHAVELAARAAGEGWTAVVAAGGDGTVHEVANGLLREAGPGGTLPLGIVPVGSGNDFAKLVGAPTDAAAAVRRILASAPRRVDAGRLNGRFFTNGVGIGLDARVGIEAAKVRRLRGIAIYLWALARVLPRFRPPRMRVELDGALVADGPLTLVTAANGGCHGGGFWICPAARIDDGELDVAVAEAMGALGILDLLPRVMRGTHVGRPGVRMLRGRRLRVTSPDPLPVHADGEVVSEAAHELEIEVLPGALTVLGSGPPPGPLPNPSPASGRGALFWLRFAVPWYPPTLVRGETAGRFRLAHPGGGRPGGGFPGLPEPAQETGSSTAGLRSGPPATRPPPASPPAERPSGRPGAPPPRGRG